ncbi:hypothetical protein DOK67_0002325 [Enterococcus sp. DIV0212c]|uniref:YfhO family protein n=1 Tax=Enterococcus sp. DIV0212c TaxID=2230867 RepID=UPI001A9B4242|nr:YfhO family protein [Enterococcus sp. DIV0212c]MBO1355269.1 YfhO family protein [Enterococcus sp. DIV0212c]
MKGIKWMKKKGWALGLSVVIPMLIMAIVYLSYGIYPGSDRVVLASDALSQGSNFFASLRDVLHGKGSFFYSWHGSLGLNYWSLMAYYLNGIFSPIVFFFDKQWMPDALYVILLLKFGTIGGSFWFMSDKIYNLPQPAKIVLSISYALSGFAVAYSPQQMWLDGLFYLPLIVLGIHQLMDEKRVVLLFFSYLFLFLSNFYMAFMIGVFTFLYALCRSLTNPKQYIERLPAYFITSLLAGGASMVTILPTLLDLKNNGESLDSLTNFWTRDTGLWDIPVKTMVGIYDTSKYGSAPFIYFGQIGLLFCLVYFIHPKIAKRKRILYGGLFIFLILSVYIDPLNLFWHGFHAPYMFLFRFSFLFSFFGLFLAGFAMEKITKEDSNRLVNCSIILLLVYIFASFLANRRKYDYLGKSSLIITVVLLLSYLVLLMIQLNNKKKTNWIWLLFCLLFLGEVSFNTFNTIGGINNEWGYPERKAYDKYYKDIQSLVEQANTEDEGNYRLTNLDATSRNESFIYGYSGVAMFSSIRNRHSSQYLNLLGFRSTGTNLVILYENNTLIMDALLGIKYNLSQEPLSKYGFKEKTSSGKYRLYENQFALPLGIVTDQKIYEKEAVKNQTELMQYLSDVKKPLFTFSEVTLKSQKYVEIKEKEEAVFYSPISTKKRRQVVYSVEVPAFSQGYLSLYGYGDVNVLTKIGDVTRKTDLLASGQYYDLGYYEQKTTVDVTVEFVGEAVVQLSKPIAMFLDTRVFEEAVSAVQEKGVVFHTSGRKATAEVDLEKEQVVLTTIPYDQGWKAYIDGKQAEIPTFKEAFLTLVVPKGQHTITFEFIPQGFRLGLSLFIGCTSLFIAYNWKQKKSKRRN